MDNFLSKLEKEVEMMESLDEGSPNKVGRSWNYNLFANINFLAVQDSSITDIVCPLVGPLEPTNNQSLGSIKEWP